MRVGATVFCILLSGLFAGSALAQSSAANQVEPGVSVTNPTEAGFRQWVADFRPRALAAGVTGATFDAAMADVHLNLKTIERDRTQNEFSKQIWEYLETAVSDARVSNGRKAMAAHKSLLDQIEQKYGVEKQVVSAIWGLESAYGSYRGNTPVLESLATLAYDGRRGAFFSNELIEALKILQAGHVPLADFKGSWAGASGHTQFMPSSFRNFAQDWTGDGKRNLWSDDPADALASTAAYLRDHGWQHGLPWGLEVTLPDDFPWEQTGERIRKPVGYWTNLGVRDIEGKPIPDYGPASILLPAGHTGARFMIFENFHVIEKYNTADAYVIAVGNLSDRLMGGPAIRHGWPEDDRALTYDEKKELQQRLLDRGFDPQGVDGIMGPNTIEAVRMYQRSEGRVIDGYASLKVLNRLRTGE